MKNIFLPVVALILLNACESSEFDLERSIYVPDTQFTSLPAYSEWGYNTFGAFYERKIFIFSNSEVPAKIIHTNNLARLVLKGGLTSSTYESYYYNGYYFYDTPMSLSFDLPEFHPETYEDLIELNDTSFDLAQPGLNVTAIIGNDTIALDIFKGTLYFKRAQHLFVDNHPVNVILSGYFGFQALVNGEPVSMSQGRFDIGIGEYQFARY